jgi:hypothetical protein
MIARACADARAGERAAAPRKASFERSAGSAEPQYHAARWDEILPSSRRVGGIVASEGMLVLRNLSIPTQLHAALRKCARHRARRNRSNRLSSSCRVQVRWRTSLSFPALTHAAHRAPEPASRRCRQDRTLLLRSTRANPALRQRQRPASSRGMGWWRHGPPLRVGSRPFGLATAVRCPSRIRSGPSCPRR